ncbi:MAG: hypothetical protein ABII90_16260 [Bacteroidota bacterium]
MKTLLIIAFTFLTFCQINAQNSLLNFNEENILINGISVNVGNTILNGDMKEINKSWKAFIKTHINEKMNDDNGVLVVKETVINQITDKRGDLLAYIYNKDNEISLNIAYRLGYDIYLNSSQYSEEFGKFKGFVNYFVCNYYNDYLPKYIKEKNKNIKLLQKENRKSEKSIKKSQKQNNKYTKKNRRSQKKIIRIDSKLNNVEDENKKSISNTSKTDIEKKILENEKNINYNIGLIETQQSIITTLKPKIDTLTNDINSAKLTLIEVRSKVKTFK